MKPLDVIQPEPERRGPDDGSTPPPCCAGAGAADATIAPAARPSFRSLDVLTLAGEDTPEAPVKSCCGGAEAVPEKSCCSGTGAAAPRQASAVKPWSGSRRVPPTARGRCVAGPGSAGSSRRC